MNRKNFFKAGLIGLGNIVALPAVIASCSEDDINVSDPASNDPATGDCDLTPNETAGPFPTITPSDLAMQNIIGNRTGVALLITLTIQDQSNDCNPLSGAIVDLWQCDAEGNYSQYGETRLQQTDYRNENFLRGRQTTNEDGQISFISIFPGWYPGRSPHFHLEIFDSDESSLKTTQVAFPKNVCDTVYATDGYNGEADTLNENDNFFSDSLDGNMADSITGNITDGYTLLKTIIV
ncbi:MAG: intradiol ring-cleavage dioxygenase [Cyclobacteriaceae bacterium]